MEKMKLLALVPLDGIREVMNAVAQKREDITFSCRVETFDGGAQERHPMSEDGQYDIIVSYTPSENRIRRVSNTLLLDFLVSDCDILQSISLSKNYLEKFCIAGFSGITSRAKRICGLTQYAIPIVTLEAGEDIGRQFSALKSHGYTMVICDASLYVAACRCGLNTVLIMPSEDSVEQLFDQAVSLYQSFAAVQSASALFLDALKAAPFEALIYSAGRDLLFSTLQRSPQNEALFAFVENALPQLLGQESANLEKAVGSQFVSLHSQMSFYNGQAVCLVSLAARSRPPIFDDTSVEILNGMTEFGTRKSSQFSDYYGSFINSNSVSSIRQQIEDYSHSKLPVVITGELGTGKDPAATMLYENSPLSSNPFYIINCETISKKQWMALVSNPSSPLHGTNCTLYFKHTQLLSNEQADLLRPLIDASGLFKRNLTIFSFEVPNHESCSQYPFLNHLLNVHACLSLYLPPLRCRAADIPSLLTLYLSKLNAQLGKQIIGFEPDGMELLQKYSWPRNMDQFNRVVRELVVASHELYISRESVEACLKKESALYPGYQPGDSFQINLDQKLADIETDIVRLVLQQENGSQKKASERLGISRSTIWRMLRA